MTFVKPVRISQEKLTGEIHIIDANGMRVCGVARFLYDHAPRMDMARHLVEIINGELIKAPDLIDKMIEKLVLHAELDSFSADDQRTIAREAIKVVLLHIMRTYKAEPDHAYAVKMMLLRTAKENGIDLE